MIRQAPRELALVFRRPQIDADDLLGAVYEMDVRVVEAREHQPARQVDDARLRAGQLPDVIRPAHGCDPLTADRDRLRERDGAVDGVDISH